MVLVECVVGQETTIRVSADGLSAVTALAATTAGLQQTLCALAQAHGGRGGIWLDDLEEQLVRDAKNIVFNGASMEAEADAVDFAVTNLRMAIDAVRQRLD